MTLSESITFWIGKGIASLIPLAILFGLAAVIFGGAIVIDAATAAARRVKRAAAGVAHGQKAWWASAGPVPFIVLALAVTVLAIVAERLLR